MTGFLHTARGKACFLPFMLAAVPVRPAQADRILAVVHADGTTRPQLVLPDGSVWRALLEQFYLHRRADGAEHVAGAGPIVETPEQALRLCRRVRSGRAAFDDVLVVAVRAFALPKPGGGAAL